MKKKVSIVLALITLLMVGTAGVSRAADAEVLPKGVWTIRAENLFYLPIEKKFGADGRVEEAASDFNATLGANVFPDLAFLQPAVDLLAPGSGLANIGASEVTFKYKIDTLNTVIGYGITDKLTVGVFIPYLWQRNEVTANLNTTNANIGVNPFFQQGVLPAPLDGSPLVPIAAGGQPLTKDDVQRILGPGLDINADGIIDIAGFGYKPIQTWSDQGLGDIDLGLKYQYYQSSDWRLAFTGGVRMPTGKVDDPDNLVDRGFGTGAWGLLFRFNNDYTGIKNLVVDATINYDLYLPAHETLRILSDPHQPITDRKESVDRNIGDVFEFEASTKYSFNKEFSWLLLYKYGYAWKDKVTGPQGSIQAMEDDTNYREQILYTGLTYSTVDMYLAKKFPVPMNFSVNYRNRFSGANVLKSQYISLAVQIYF